MSMNMFDSSPVSFRMFKVSDAAMPLLENCRAEVMPDLDSMDKAPISGYVESKRHFGRVLTPENLVFGDFTCMGLAMAEKKIPPSLLEIKLNEAMSAEKAARGVEFLSRMVKSEIKAEIVDRLTPDMPQVVTIIPFVVDSHRGRMLAGALTDNHIDCLSLRFRKTSGESPILMTPNVIAIDRNRIDSRNLTQLSFSPDLSIEPTPIPSLGMEFLTWLWCNWELHGGCYGMEGPITLYREGEGAHEVTLRKGTPLNCAEAGKAMMCGKQLSNVKLSMVANGEMFSVSVDSEFCFKNLTLPKGEAASSNDRFFDRMRNVNNFIDCFLSLFDDFMTQRADEDAWTDTVADIRQWIQLMNK